MICLQVLYNASQNTSNWVVIVNTFTLVVNVFLWYILNIWLHNRRSKNQIRHERLKEIFKLTVFDKIPLFIKYLDDVRSIFVSIVIKDLPKDIETQHQILQLKIDDLEVLSKSIQANYFFLIKLYSDDFQNSVTNLNESFVEECTKLICEFSSLQFVGENKGAIFKQFDLLLIKFKTDFFELIRTDRNSV